MRFLEALSYCFFFPKKVHGNLYPLWAASNICTLAVPQPSLWGLKEEHYDHCGRTVVSGKRFPKDAGSREAGRGATSPSFSSQTRFFHGVHVKVGTGLANFKRKDCSPSHVGGQGWVRGSDGGDMWSWCCDIRGGDSDVNCGRWEQVAMVEFTSTMSSIVMVVVLLTVIKVMESEWWPGKGECDIVERRCGLDKLVVMM